MRASELVIGLMTGTSLDGIDAVLVEMASGLPELLQTAYLPYPAALRNTLLALHVASSNELHQAALLAQQLAQHQAEAIQLLLDKAAVSATTIRAIGSHGQTVRHAPQQGYTIQLNNPALLAELSGITVVADFRSRDIAAGGEGAPLVPAFHAARFAHARLHRVILNIGGIANITDLPPGKPVRGFDCGPGNMLLDAWAERHLGQRYDAQGAWGATGTRNAVLLHRLLEHPFFRLSPPKSCGREQFNLAWLDNLLGHSHDHHAPADIQATLLALTATSIQRAIVDHCSNTDEIYVCGGGAHNTALLASLGELLPHIRIHSTADLGLPPDWVEAMAFAWLAWRTLQGLPGNLPEVTGARGPRVLGAIYPA
ncbi:MAG: anhydro-N-acetylmuramic acid kinase [Sterolibacterium sp.]|nr:anhydro-N-acetylmuramic acid kinase [Sterolibacterium sp.]